MKSAQENIGRKKSSLLFKGGSTRPRPQDDSQIDAGSSFVPHQELRQYISTITPLSFSNLVSRPEEICGLFKGTSELSISDTCEEHELELPTTSTSGRPRTVYLRFSSGKTGDVLTRDDAVIANSPQRLFQAHRKESTGHVFFTYMLSTCGTSENRLCFTLAQRAFSFEAATKHQHLFFLRMHSKVYAAGELAVYGPPGRPNLIVMNRMSGTVMRPLENSNRGVDFDTVVALAARQFFGAAWTVLQAPEGTGRRRFSGEDWIRDLPALHIAATEDRLKRPLIVIGKGLPVFDVLDPKFAPLADKTHTMSMRTLMRRFPDASMWSTCTAVHDLREQMARLTTFHATLAELHRFAKQEEEEGAPEKAKKNTLQKIRLKEKNIQQVVDTIQRQHLAEQRRLGETLGLPVSYTTSFTLRDYQRLLASTD